MKRKSKDRVLGRLARHLARFYPELADTFLCPTCLTTIPSTQGSQISEAHIVPKAGGGRMCTYLCRSCNSAFGSKQDKWFGEYAHLRRERKDLLESRVKAGYFSIDGSRYGGTFTADRKDGIKFYVYRDKSSPEAVKRLEYKSRVAGLDGAKITIPIPLRANENLLNVGFLTAAYLLWFRELGYSWVLQDHLSSVREQIRNPEATIIQGRYAVPCRDVYFDHPWVGVVRHQGELVLVAGIADRLVSLPPVDRPGEAFVNLAQPEGTFTADYRRLSFYQNHKFDGPLTLAFEDRFLVMPDVLLRGSAKGHAVMFPRWNSAPVFAGFVPEDEATKISKLPNVRIIEAKYQPIVPSQDTGRMQPK